MDRSHCKPRRAPVRTAIPYADWDDIGGGRTNRGKCAPVACGGELTICDWRTASAVLASGDALSAAGSERRLISLQDIERT